MSFCFTCIGQWEVRRQWRSINRMSVSLCQAICWWQTKSIIIGWGPTNAVCLSNSQQSLPDECWLSLWLEIFAHDDQNMPGRWSTYNIELKAIHCLLDMYNQLDDQTENVRSNWKSDWHWQLKLSQVWSNWCLWWLSNVWENLLSTMAKK